MATTAAMRRGYAGPAVLSYGFRPFFLGAGVWAVIAAALWLPVFYGEIDVPAGLTPIEWHVHELVFGYVPAVMAGFLLTAVPNWTGRLPVIGMPLLALFLTWAAGRAAMLGSGSIGLPLAAAIDLAFLASLASVIAREIVASGNMRNLKVLAGIGLLLAANALFHLEAIASIGEGHGVRLGIAATLVLIMLIGGRIIPSFTRNWLARRAPGRLPAAFDRTDMATIALSALALGAWVMAPDSRATAGLAVAAGAANVFRLARWAGWRTAAEPLVLILHAGFAYVPIGFFLLAASIVWPEVLMPAGALHGWTIGAVGLMTLAVMTRASLGHTGRDLVATRPIQLIYLLVFLSAQARIAAAFGVARDVMLHAAAGCWVIGFLVFCVVYAPMLLRRTP
jgi:uncharacterized protein involved in response to NO